MNIKLYSAYEDRFKNHLPKEGEDYIECFDDLYVTKAKVINPEKTIAIIHEPRPLQPNVYKYIEKHYKDFKYVFTHDSILLKTLPNAKLVLWCRHWNCSFRNDEKDFIHPISMVASYKEQAPVRIQRKQLAFELKGIIDTYGTFDGGKWVRPEEVYAKYPFSVVIENHIDDWWITEKIVNCFLCNTVPIYWGGKNVDKLFNSDGIIIVNSPQEIKKVVKYLLTGNNAREEYEKRLDAIKDNRERAKQYSTIEEWFYRTYGDLLEEMGNGNNNNKQ